MEINKFPWKEIKTLDNLREEKEAKRSQEQKENNSKTKEIEVAGDGKSIKTLKENRKPNRFLEITFKMKLKHWTDNIKQIAEKINNDKKRKVRIQEKRQQILKLINETEVNSELNEADNEMHQYLALMISKWKQLN